jgi:hypothetical protein
MSRNCPFFGFAAMLPSFYDVRTVG